MKKLRDLTIGVYQIRQANSYSKEHQTDAWKYQIFVNKEQDGVLKAQIRSGHTNSRTYHLWIEHSTSLNPITGWFCTCKLGARVVGCCAHIASAFWYLGFERHQTATQTPKAHNKYMDSLTDAAAEVWESISNSFDESNLEQQTCIANCKTIKIDLTINDTKSIHSVETKQTFYTTIHKNLSYVSIFFPIWINEKKRNNRNLIIYQFLYAFFCIQWHITLASDLLKISPIILQ